MSIYLVRHAHAGSRQSSSAHDRYRTLSDKGWKRASKLVDVLAGVDIELILSSPATRCVQTVEPLATARGLQIVEHDDLWEDAATADVMAILEKHRDTETVICSHGNLIPVVVEQLADAGARVRGRGCEKGSIWVLDHNGRAFSHATYISRNSELILD